MEQKNMAVLMKIVIVIMGIVGIICFADIIPGLGRYFVDEYKEFSGWYMPWLIFLDLLAIPFYAILVLGWIVSSEIGRDKSFSDKNAKLIKAASVITLSASVYFFVGNMVLFFLQKNHPGVILASILVVFVGFAVTVGFALLSHLIMKAAKLQEQNDLTI